MADAIDEKQGDDDLHFEDKAELVEHCKAAQCRIHVEGDAPNNRFLRAADVDGWTQLVLSTRAKFKGGFAHRPEDGPSNYSNATMDEMQAGLRGIKLSIFVSPELREELEGDLNAVPTSEVRRLSSWPIERCFAYLDISDFSKFKPGEQALVMQSLTRLLDLPIFQQAIDGDQNDVVVNARQDLETALCIGDGYIYVSEKEHYSVFLMAALAWAIDQARAVKAFPVDFHYRIGIHSGEVYCLWENVEERWNYIGEGINGGQRVLSAIGKSLDDVIFVSDAVQEALLRVPVDSKDYSHAQALYQQMDSRGRKKDKHGKAWRIFQLNHMRLLDWFQPNTQETVDTARAWDKRPSAGGDGE